jgi:hypothetical protein
MPKLKFTVLLATLMSLGYAAHAATPTNMAGYWALDEAEKPAVAADDTGTSDGLIRGEVQFGVEGVRSNSTAAKFEGNGKYLEIPHHDDFLLNEGTISFWFRSNKTSTRMGLLSKDSNGLDTGGHLSIWIESNNHVIARIQSATGSYQVETNTSIVKEQWHHVAVVFGIRGFGIYLDGVLEATDNYAGGLGDNSGGAGNYEPISIGALSWLSGNQTVAPLNDYFDGRIDDIGIISEKWSASIIADLFTQTGPGTTMTLGDFSTVPVFYVRTRGSDSNNGLTPQSSFRTVQKAIDSCVRPGTLVYVGSGTYRESLVIGTGSSINAVAGSEYNHVRLIADIDGTKTFDSPGEILIDGQNNQSIGIDVATLTNWNLEGFTLRNFRDYSIRMNSGSINVLGCTIKVAQTYGIYSRATGDITVADTVFERDAQSAHICWIQPNNSANPVQVVVTRNDATMKGALYQSTGYQNGWQALRNRPWRTRYMYGFIVYGWGGGAESIEISNNQISDCYLPMYAMLFSSNGSAKIINNTITNSTYGIHSYGYRAGVITISNNIIENNYYGTLANSYQSQTPIFGPMIEHNIAFSMVRYRRPFESSVITSDPLFTDAINGDFSLTSGSPGIDTGLATNAPALDIASNARPTDGDNDGLAQIDIGAYELVNERAKIKVVQWREIGVDSGR